MQKLIMKNLFKLSALAFVFALIFSACTEDSTDPIREDAPIIRLISGTGLTTGDITIEAGKTFTVRLGMQAGTYDLQSLRVFEDGVALPTARYTLFDVIGNKSVQPQTTQLLTPLVVNDEATLELTITAPTTEGSYDYEFRVTDVQNLTAKVDLTVTTEIPTTPISMTLEGVLFNQAGPSGTGGLDLDTGTSTGSSAAAAEIRDMGLDCTIPAPGLNWRRQIGSVNGTIIRKVDKTALENFTFDNVTAIEEIVGAYETGDELGSGQISNCANTNKTDVAYVTGVVAVGDLFTVKKDSKYYLIRIDEVNETNNNNNDNYVISIKY